jgi:hypothetical protein
LRRRMVMMRMTTTLWSRSRVTWEDEEVSGMMGGGGTGWSRSGMDILRSLQLVRLLCLTNTIYVRCREQCDRTQCSTAAPQTCLPCGAMAQVYLLCIGEMLMPPVAATSQCRSIHLHETRMKWDSGGCSTAHYVVLA